MRNKIYTRPVVLKDIPDDSHNFKPLPAPTGQYPYRLALASIREITPAESLRMSFHMVGDTGSIRHSQFQAVLAAAVCQQSATEPALSFLYHLGDIVYNHGEAHAYAPQFLKHYEDYPHPIFAIAGNHDGDINPNSETPYQSLDAFMDVFCDTHRRPIGFGNGSRRYSMIQPNVYWTLETPLARFIGLYANVTKYGMVTDEQRNWFVEELLHAEANRAEQAVIVCIHHAPYSADTNHGSSLAMIAFLEDAFQKTGVRPDAVFSGHVHNYQRFEKSDEDGHRTPYIVAGAGGYADLHAIATLGDPRVDCLPGSDNIELKAFCDRHFGFLQLTIERVQSQLQLSGTYYCLPEVFTTPELMQAEVYDRFTIPIRRTEHNTSTLG
ncbi:metallophosphoesterase family protein [Sphingobacterium suaedae]|uniref:Metallophosphoesterase family protein n=1 Tax=Sphingobacterium suaedae TaxID=1686402 RepID=A0ABW5KFR9_9SPHI